MKKIALVFLSGALLAGAAQAQEVVQRMEQVQSSGVTQSGRAKKAPAKLTKEQQERAMQLLEGAEAGARALDPGSRAYSLMQIARVYQTSNKAKASELLEDAVSAAKLMAEENPRLKVFAGRLQQQAMVTLVQVDPQKAEELLPQIEVKSRERVLNALLEYYEHNNQLDRAIETVFNIGNEGEMPYGAISKIMEKLTPEQSGEKQRLFTAALGSFSNRDTSQGSMTFGDGDFGNLIVRFQRELPPALIRQAIDVVLDQARKQAERDAQADGPTRISIASANGAVQLNSAYQYRLFQLLPVLRSLDEQAADRLMKEQTDVQQMLAKYPQGLDSVAPNVNAQSGQKRPSGGTSFSVGSGRSSGPDAARNPGDNLLDQQLSAKIIADAEDHPQDAVANAARIQTPHLRTAAYISIARAAMKKNSSTAREALSKALDASDKMAPDPQVLVLNEIAQLYIRLNDTDAAKKVIERGLATADKVYKDDVNADDPNKAPKAYWPSTVAWRSMLSLASEISPLWAAELLKEISDDEVKTIAQLGISMALLHKQSPQTEVMSINKQGGVMRIMNFEREPD